MYFFFESQCGYGSKSPVPEERATAKHISWRLGIGQNHLDPPKIVGSIVFNPKSDEYSQICLNIRMIFPLNHRDEFYDPIGTPLDTSMAAPTALRCTPAGAKKFLPGCRTQCGDAPSDGSYGTGI